MTETRKYLWKVGQPDFRDLQFKGKNWLERLAVRWGINIFKWTYGKIDMRPDMPPVVDQGALGSCTANSICSVMRYTRKIKDKPNDVDLSRLFLYYNERVLLAPWAVPYDTGAIIRDGIKSIVQQGSIPESEWPYDITQFAVQPSDQCYTDALKDLAIKYYYVPQDSENLKCALVEGYPIIFGFTVYSSFEAGTVAQDGIVPMPAPDESILGGHCVNIVGFDNSKKWFICRNSWGEGWGDKGYFYMPYDYIMNPNLCSDFWIIEATTG